MACYDTPGTFVMHFYCGPPARLGVEVEVVVVMGREREPLWRASPIYDPASISVSASASAFHISYLLLTSYPSDGRLLRLRTPIFLYLLITPNLHADTFTQKPRLSGSRRQS